MTRNITGPIPALIHSHAKYVGGRSSQREPERTTEITARIVFTVYTLIMNRETGNPSAMEEWSPLGPEERGMGDHPPLHPMREDQF